MKTHYRIDLPNNCSVIVLYHAQDTAAVKLGASDSAVHQYEARFPAGSEVRIVETDGEFAVSIVIDGDEPLGTDVLSPITSQPTS